MADWTKESVEKEIRSQGRHCRGLCVLPAETQKALNQAWQDVLATRVWADAVKLQTGLETALKRGHVEVPDADWEMMHRHIRGLWDSRLGCGYDINEIILKGALDGEIHTFTCPRCGIEARYIPGIFEGVPSLVDDEPSLVEEPTGVARGEE